MEAAGAQAELFALLLGGVQQAREPGERDAEDTAIAQLDPEAVFVEADLSWADLVGLAEVFIPRPLDSFSVAQEHCCNPP